MNFIYVIIQWVFVYMIIPWLFLYVITPWVFMLSWYDQENV